MICQVSFRPLEGGLQGQPPAPPRIPFAAMLCSHRTARSLAHPPDRVLPDGLLFIDNRISSDIGIATPSISTACSSIVRLRPTASPASSPLLGWRQKPNIQKCQPHDSKESIGFFCPIFTLRRQRNSDAQTCTMCTSCQMLFRRKQSASSRYLSARLPRFSFRSAARVNSDLRRAVPRCPGADLHWANAAETVDLKCRYARTRS